jgi:hypothetical protein
MGKHNISAWLGKPTDCVYNEIVGRIDPWQRFAAEIVIAAVNDWRTLIKCGAWEDDKPDKYCNFDELRQFFTGEWCAFLMLDFEMEPERILELLEAELQEAMRQPVRRRRKGGIR